MPKVHLSTIFSLQLIPEAQHKDLQKKIKDNPFMIHRHQEVILFILFLNFISFHEKINFLYKNEKYPFF